MSVASNVVKVTAKTALKGNYLKGIISGCVLLFCLIINYYISSLVELVSNLIIAEIYSLLFSVFVTFPLLMGVLRYFWRMIMNTTDNPMSVFYYFSEKALYFKTLKLFFTVAIRLLPIAVLIYLPAVFVWLLSQSRLFELFDLSIPIWSSNLQYAILFTNTLCTVIIAFISLRYYIAPILFISNDDLDVMEALHMSCVISKKSAFDFIFLFLSFLGWILLSILAFPLIFTLPYILTSYTIHSRFVIAEYNKHIANTAAKQYPSFTVGA